MNRIIPWVIGSALIVGATGMVIATAEQDNGAILIAGDKPVSEDQVRQKMQWEGWSNFQIVHDGRYLQVVGPKDGQPNQITVDSQTGRLQAADDKG
jgi:hypothetical protein